MFSLIFLWFLFLFMTLNFAFSSFTPLVSFNDMSAIWKIILMKRLCLKFCLRNFVLFILLNSYDSFIPSIVISKDFLLLSELYIKKMYIPDSIPNVVFQNLCLQTTPWFGETFCPVFPLWLSSLLGNIIINLCHKKGSPLTAVSIIFLFYPLFFLRFLNLSLMGRFISISILLVLSLIAIRTLIRTTLLVIIFLLSLSLFFPSPSFYFAVAPDICPDILKPLIEFGTKLLFLKKKNFSDNYDFFNLFIKINLCQL